MSYSMLSEGLYIHLALKKHKYECRDAQILVTLFTHGKEQKISKLGQSTELKCLECHP